MKKKKWRVGDILRYQWELEKDSREEEGQHERRRLWFKQSGFGEKEKKKALRSWLESRRDEPPKKGESGADSWGTFYSVFIALFFLWGLISAWIATWAVLVVPSGMGIYFFVAMFFLVGLPLLFTLFGFYFFFRKRAPGLLFGGLGRVFFTSKWVSRLLGKKSFGLPEGVAHHLLHFGLSQGGAFQRLLKQAFQYRGVGFNFGVFVAIFSLGLFSELDFKSTSTLCATLSDITARYANKTLCIFLLGSVAFCIFARLVLLFLVMCNNRFNLINFRDKKSEKLWEEMTTPTKVSTSGKEPPPEESIPEKENFIASHSSEVVVLAPNHRRDLTKERLGELCSWVDEIQEILYVSQDDEEDEAILRSLPERVSIEGVVLVLFEGFRPCTEEAVMYVEAIQRGLPLEVSLRVGLVSDEQASQSMSPALFKNWCSRIPSGTGCGNIQVIPCGEENKDE